MFQPLGDRILAKRLEQPRPKSSLIEIPETVVDKPSQYAVVLAVGKLAHAPELQRGHVIIIKDFAGTPVQTPIADGEEPEDCIILVEDDVLAITEVLL